MSAPLNRVIHPASPRVAGEEGGHDWLRFATDLLVAWAWIGAIGSSSGGPVLSFSLVAVLWVMWWGHAAFEARFELDDVLARLKSVTMLLALAAMGSVTTSVVERSESASVFLTGAAISAAVVSLLYFRSNRSGDAEAVGAGPRAVAYAGLGVGLGLCSLLGGTVAVYLAALLCVIVLVALLARARDGDRFEQSAVLERMAKRGASLCRSFLIVGGFYALQNSRDGLGGGSALGTVSGMTLVGLALVVWWDFLDLARSSRYSPRKDAYRIAFVLHLLTVGGFGFVAAGLEALTGTAESGGPSAWQLIPLGLALIYLSAGLLSFVAERPAVALGARAQATIRLAIAACATLLYALAGQLEGGHWYLLLFALAFGALVLDHVVAPFKPSPSNPRSEGAASKIAAFATDPERGPRAVYDREKDGLKLRVRSEGQTGALGQDLYYFFMEGSWWRAMVTLLVGFLLMNVTFAGLFMLDEQSISAEGGVGFAEAFAFSVQTMSTIGYGGMTPANAWGDFLVTIEAATAMIGVAVATGLIFARVARPSSAVIFSRPVVLTQWEGKQALMFRAANARSNEVVDAQVRVDIARDVETSEGHRMRRLFELKLVRNRSPLFRLSWTVMHIIDEDSPLADVDWSDEAQIPFASIIVTLIGYDATYAQTTHARHLYLPDELYRGYRLKDVIRRDGDTIVMNYRSFHDIEPDPSVDFSSPPRTSTDRDDSSAPGENSGTADANE